MKKTYNYRKNPFSDKTTWVFLAYHLYIICVRTFIVNQMVYERQTVFKPICEFND